jgi:hypothetical protein
VTSDFYHDLGPYYRALIDAWVAHLRVLRGTFLRGKTAPRQSNADRAPRAPEALAPALESCVST